MSIYCHTIENIKLVFENLAFGLYYNGIPDKDQILYNFNNNTKTNLLTCSSALCVEFDYHLIGYIFHYLFYLFFPDFAQGNKRVRKDQKSLIQYILCRKVLITILKTHKQIFTDYLIYNKAKIK